MSARNHQMWPAANQTTQGAPNPAAANYQENLLRKPNLFASRAAANVNALQESQRWKAMQENGPNSGSMQAQQQAQAQARAQAQAQAQMAQQQASMSAARYYDQQEKEDRDDNFLNRDMKDPSKNKEMMSQHMAANENSRHQQQQQQQQQQQMWNRRMAPLGYQQNHMPNHPPPPNGMPPGFPPPGARRGENPYEAWLQAKSMTPGAPGAAVGRHPQMGGPGGPGPTNPMYAGRPTAHSNWMYPGGQQQKGMLGYDGENKNQAPAPANGAAPYNNTMNRETEAGKGNMPPHEKRPGPPMAYSNDDSNSPDRKKIKPDQRPQLSNGTGPAPTGAGPAPGPAPGHQGPPPGLGPVPGPAGPMHASMPSHMHRPMHGPSGPMPGQGPPGSMHGPSRPMHGQGPPGSMHGPSGPMRGPSGPMHGPSGPMPAPRPGPAPGPGPAPITEQPPKTESSNGQGARGQGKSNTSALDFLCSAALEMGPLKNESVVIQQQEQANLNDSHNGCSCSKSHCIKLYCECFKAGLHCDEKCACANCKNTTAESGMDGERTKAIKATLSRNPLAFTSAQKELPQPSPGETACRCIKSRCLKLYCDCFQSKKVCNASCSCVGCLNTVQESGEGGKRKYAIEQCLEKRPDAFKKKIKEVGSGCACKNNRCLKKYCDCFRFDLVCGDHCTCKDCGNNTEAARLRVPDIEIHAQ